MALTKIQGNAIADSAVSSAKIASSAVTSAKINIDSDITFNGSNIKNAGASETTVTSVSNVVLLNYANSAVFTCTISGDTTLTPNNVPVGGCVMLLKLTNGGDYTVSYAGNPRFASNTAPTLTASGLDYLYFTCSTDSNYLVTPYAAIAQYQ